MRTPSFNLNLLRSLIISGGLLLLLFPHTKLQAAPPDMVLIPSQFREIVDGRTGIPIRVQVDSFLIGRTEVSQGSYRAVTGKNPSRYAGDSRPVENVSWWDAIAYCNKLSAREKLDPCYNLKTGECDFSKNGYRLPTDAEWSITLDGAFSNIDTLHIHRYANIGSSNTTDLDSLLRSVRQKGTTDTASYLPSDHRVYDLIGNVWEWCYDFYDPIEDHPATVHNPHGPTQGLDRIVRGGSFVTTVSEWNLGYRSSMRPESHSRFTGFRVARSLGPHSGIVPADTGSAWFHPYNNPPPDYTNVIGYLSSLIADSSGKMITTTGEWASHREQILRKWQRLLGSPGITPPAPAVRKIRTYEGDDYTGRLLDLQVEPDFWEKIYVMYPATPAERPAPVVIVPYYDVDVPAGKNMGGRDYRPMGVRTFGYHMVQQGYIAVAIKWFGESYGESYDEAVANLWTKYPSCTGMGKWVWDAHRLVDYIETLPGADTTRIGIIGHSLGGKMALYAAAFDKRISCTVASEPGIGLQFSNYNDYWYFGSFIDSLDQTTDQHELLGLIAPRPFLLIGGDTYDTAESWYYINAAREVYSLFDKPQNIGYFNHHSGHAPTPEAVRMAINWFRHFWEGDGSGRRE